MNLFAFVLDISKMFLRIKLHQDKDYLRYLWRNCETSEKVQILRMLSLTFGVISSPFQAVDIVLKHADMLEEKFPLAAESVRDQLYVDDVPDGHDSEDNTQKKLEELLHFFLEASMQPHKFASNSKKVLENIPTELQSKEEMIKVLGVFWHTTKDVFTFDIKQKNEKENSIDTKRSFLEFSASIFDPLGLLAPLTIKIKLLFQEVWLNEQKEDSKLKKGWDSKLPEEIQEKWNIIKEEIPELNKIEKSRCFFTQEQKNPVKIKLFAFGDASVRAYATAIYIVGFHEDGSVSSNLAFSKSRVAPLKMVQNMEEKITIVRLELLSALITARAVKYVEKAIEKKMKVSEIHCFTDSLINLCRLRKGPDRYKMWVANRLTEVIDLTPAENWRHCPGVQNPADLPTRGLSAEELKDSTLWWNGPDFIKQDQSTWPTSAEIKLFDDPEAKKKETENYFEDLIGTISANEELQSKQPIKWDFILNIVSRYEHWFKTIKLFAFILRFGSKKRRQKFAKTEFSTEEKSSTENFLWSLTQRQHYSEEFQKLKSSQKLAEKSKLACYNPEIDIDENIIRSNTRLQFSNLPMETKRSIILPKNCPIVSKFIMELHRANYHAKAGYLHSIIKEKFIIPQGRNQIKKAIKTCTQRKCVSPMPLTQQMAPLPNLRTDDPAPFKSVAVDLFGPMVVHHKCEFQECPHKKEENVHVALFTCFHSRAVHLEIVETTGTESFLNAFRSFTARRGNPTTMYSDNAKGFKAAAKEVRALYRSINWNRVTEEGIKKNIEWFFSTERAPHQNGLCERLVRTVKTPLRIAIGAARLTRNQLAIVMTEVEAVVNNRPLCVTSNSPEDLIPITPMELVNGRKLDQLPDPNKRQNVTGFAHLWRKRQAILNQFWKRWHNDYLLSQNIRKIWKNPTFQDLKDRLVLIREDNMSRNEWKIGRIVEMCPSKDGLIRNVVVKTHSSTLRRPVQKLALFENY
jgi:hypothetical protein